MGGFMRTLRWAAAAFILANCVMMTIEAELASRSFCPAPSKPLVAHDDQVRWARR
jgi:hypothetical protein